MRNEVSGSLLLVTHVPIRQTDEGIFIDDQTARGIAQWCRYFDRVTYIGIADTSAPSASSSHWVDLRHYPEAANCLCLAMPSAYSAIKMARRYRSARKQLAQAVKTHDFLCFTIGGLIGDWPAIAALEAIRQKREFTAWLDRVEAEVIKSTLAGASFKRRAKSAVMIPIMDRYQRYILSRSSTALLQGMDTFNYFAGSAPNPHCIYDTHTTEADQIEEARRIAKRNRILSGAPLDIVYAGRATAMKGTGDWLSVLEELAARSVPFRARWIGDGPDLEQMTARIAASPLKDKVELSGFEGDRERLLSHLRQSDLLLFCHKSMESPRCLIEALVSGCPIVGYHSDYAAGLTAISGGSALGAKDDIGSLSDIVQNLHSDRSLLAELVDSAASSGMLYSEDKVYRHRALLMGARSGTTP